MAKTHAFARSGARSAVSSVVHARRIRLLFAVSALLMAAASALPRDALAYSNSPASLYGSTNKPGSAPAVSACSNCHGTGVTVTISGSATLDKGQGSTYTVTATKAGVTTGVKMGVDIAASDGSTLSNASGMPTVVQGGGNGNEIIHASSAGTLRTTTGTTATYNFTFTMPSGAASGATYTLYATAALVGAGTGQATAFTVKALPTAPTSVSASNIGTTSLTLTWSGGGPEYRVVYKTGSTAPSSPTDGTTLDMGTATTTSITGLTHSTQYAFAVYSKLSGEATFSSSAATTTATTATAVVGPRYVNSATGSDAGDCRTEASPCKTIAYAASQATGGSPGDVVNVARGMYTVYTGEAFPIVVKSGVQLKSTGNAYDTVIDATGASKRVLETETGANSSTLIEGFTIMGGLVQLAADGSIARGGGLLIDGGSPVIRKNIFYMNEARGYAGTGSTFVSGGEAYGGAIYGSNTTPTIVNNIFRGNIARGGSGKNNFGVSTPGGGGGSGQGGGVHVSGPGGGSVTNNTFYSNSAIGGTGGASLGAGGSGGNGYYGGLFSNGLTVNNNIFALNAANGGTGGSGSPTGSSGSGGYGAMQYNSPPSGDASNNLFHGNTVNGAPSGGDTIGTNSRCFLSPGCASVLFHSEPTNLRIQTTSPAHGTGTATGAPADDFDGATRPATPSIGAFEGSVLSTGTRYVATTGTNNSDCRTSGSPCRTITYAMMRAASGAPGDAISVAPGTYNAALGEIFPIDVKSGVQLTSTGTAETTIVDANGTNRRVMTMVSPNSSTVVEKLTVKKGVAQSTADGVSIAQGGGIYLNGGAPTIRKNIIRDNDAVGYDGTATYGTGGEARGGGLYIESGTPTIVNNIFFQNRARGGYGLAVGSGAGSPGGDARGGGIYSVGTGGSVTNNTFSSNQAIGGPAGSGTTNPGPRGGNAYYGAVYSDGITLNNNIYTDNESLAGLGGSINGPQGNAAYASQFYDNTSATNNLFHANKINGLAASGESVGNNSQCYLSPCADGPKYHQNFVNFRLLTGSPAAGAGNNAATGKPADDFDGVTRPNPPAIGAFEVSDPTVTYNLVLEGWQQSPYVVTSATGTGAATFNTTTKVLTLNLPYSGLSSSETGAHIHGPAARGANAGVLFALSGANPKTDSVTLSASQETQLTAGQLYVNIHTSTYPNGELRAQIDNLGATVTYALTVTKAGTGTGTVTGTAEPGIVINCGGDCTETVPNGKTVTLSAAASTGSQFVGWSGGGCSGVSQCVVTMSAATTVTATFTNPPRLANISTRMAVLTGDDVLIGGFIIGGSTAKTVVVRARGPSLAAAGVPNVLVNPVLNLYSGQTIIASNDDWQTASNASTIQSSGFAPSDTRESAIYMTLNPGAYTAIVLGVGGTTGVGIIEVFEVDAYTTPLINIATRGPVLTGDNVMIGGFIIQGSGPQTVVVRARGPSLAAAGVPNVLVNPVMSLFSGQTVIASNDDWQTASNASTIQSSGFAPSDARESAIYITLNPGAYTAIVQGVGGTTGVGIVEVFAVP